MDNFLFSIVFLSFFLILKIDKIILLGSQSTPVNLFNSKCSKINDREDLEVICSDSFLSEFVMKPTNICSIKKSLIPSQKLKKLLNSISIYHKPQTTEIFTEQSLTIKVRKIDKKEILLNRKLIIYWIKELNEAIILKSTLCVLWPYGLLELGRADSAIIDRIGHDKVRIKERNDQEKYLIEIERDKIKLNLKKFTFNVQLKLDLNVYYWDGTAMKEGFKKEIRVVNLFSIILIFGVVVLGLVWVWICRRGVKKESEDFVDKISYESFLSGSIQTLPKMLSLNLSEKDTDFNSTDKNKNTNMNKKESELFLKKIDKLLSEHSLCEFEKLEKSQ